MRLILALSSMLNRRHLRIKILHVLYAFYQDEDRDVAKTKKALDHSIEKMHELYLLLLLMIGSMQSFAIERIEAGRKKQLPSPEDLHPNTKFVTNKPLRVLANSKNLSKAAANGRLKWFRIKLFSSCAIIAMMTMPICHSFGRSRGHFNCHQKHS